MIKMLFHLLLLLAPFISYSQTCTPDPQYANENWFIYPAPNNGYWGNTVILAPPCRSQVMTLVVPDLLDLDGFTFDVDSMVVKNVTGLPPYVTYSCATPNCSVESQSSSCLYFEGSTIVDSTLSIGFDITVYFDNDILPFISISLPDPPGEYIMWAGYSCIDIFYNVYFSHGETKGCTPFTVEYSDNSLVPFSGSDRLWIFEGGTPATSTLENPVVTYNTPGTYDTQLVYPSGFESEQTDLVEVGEYPQANFSYVDNDGQVTFTNTSTNATNYSWSFGDGTNSTALNPTHNYTQVGTYNVSLTAENDFCDNAVLRPITITMVGIRSIEKEDKLHLYPNPNNGRFYLGGSDLNAQALSWELYSATGQLIQQKTLRSKYSFNELIEIETTGVYFIKLRIDEALFSQKIIVY